MVEVARFGRSNKFEISVSLPFLTKFAPTFDNGPTNLIERTFRHILRTRRKNGEKMGSDFVDILNELLINEDTIISQAVNIFLGGYETSGTTSSMLLYSLARNLDVQKKLQIEVDAISKKTNGKIDHDAIRSRGDSILDSMHYRGSALISTSLWTGTSLHQRLEPRQYQNQTHNQHIPLQLGSA